MENRIKAYEEFLEDQLTHLEHEDDYDQPDDDYDPFPFGNDEGYDDEDDEEESPFPFGDEDEPEDEDDPEEEDSEDEMENENDPFPFGEGDSYSTLLERMRHHHYGPKNSAIRIFQGYDGAIELLKYHQNMLLNFQHERLVHLLIMLTFVFLSLILIGLSVTLTLFIPQGIVLWLLYTATLALSAVSAFYVKHYYFLENHIQALYDQTYRILQLNEI